MPGRSGESARRGGLGVGCRPAARARLHEHAFDRGAVLLVRSCQSSWPERRGGQGMSPAGAGV